MKACKKLSPYVAPGVNKAIDKSFIEFSVAKYYGVDIEYVHKKTNRSDVVKVRHIAAYFMLMANFTTQGVSDYFGYKNHSSSISLRIKIDGYMLYDEKLLNEIEDLQNIMKMGKINKTMPPTKADEAFKKFCANCSLKNTRVFKVVKCSKKGVIDLGKLKSCDLKK